MGMRVLVHLALGRRRIAPKRWQQWRGGQKEGVEEKGGEEERGWRRRGPDKQDSVKSQGCPHPPLIHTCHPKQLRTDVCSLGHTNSSLSETKSAGSKCSCVPAEANPMQTLPPPLPPLHRVARCHARTSSLQAPPLLLLPPRVPRATKAVLTCR